MFIIHPCCPARLLFASRSATLKIRPYTALGDTSLRSKTMLKTGLIAMEKVFTGMAQTSDRTMMITTTISVMPHGVSRAEKEELMSGIPPGKALECRTTHGKVQAGADKLMSDSHHEKPGMTPVARAVDPKVHTNRLKMITKIDDGRNQWQTPRRSEETYVRRPRLREKTYFRYVIPHEDRSDRDREGRPGQDRHRPVHDDDGIDYGQTAQHPPGQGGEEHVPYTVSEPGDPDFDTKQHTSRSGQPYETFRTDPENSANRGWLLGTLAQTQRELEAEEYIWNSISGPHGQSRIVPIGSELWN